MELYLSVIACYAKNVAVCLLLAGLLVGCAGSSTEPSTNASAGKETVQTAAAANVGYSGQGAPSPKGNVHSGAGNTVKAANGSSSNASLPHAATPKTSTHLKTEPSAAVTGASLGTYIPPLPVIFDVPLDVNPKKMEHRLTELGYQRQAWTLEAPYSRLTFTLADEAATFRRVDLLVCNHPLKLAGLSIQGNDPDHFYEAVKKRFNFGIAEWEKDDRADVRHGRYMGDFSGNTRVVLDSSRHGAELALEVRDVMNECQNALVKDVHDLRKAEQTDLDTARKRQRDTF